MILTIENLISILRSSVNVQLPSGEIDPEYLVMTDEELKLFIKLGVSGAYPNVEDLESLPPGSEYPIILLSKIELYLKLAVVSANDVDLGAESAYLKLDQRFQHYMSLVKEARDEYAQWTSSGGSGGTIETYNVLLGSRHFSRRNYELQKSPIVSIKIDSLTSDSVAFHWGVSNFSHFGAYKVYISNLPIVNVYRDGYSYDTFIEEGAELIASIHNIHDTYKEITDLQSDTEYHLAVFSVERNQLFGYKEITFTTLSEFDESGD